MSPRLYCTKGGRANRSFSGPYIADEQSNKKKEWNSEREEDIKFVKSSLSGRRVHQGKGEEHHAHTYLDLVKANIALDALKLQRRALDKRYVLLLDRPAVLVVHANALAEELEPDLLRFPLLAGVVPLLVLELTHLPECVEPALLAGPRSHGLLAEVRGPACQTFFFDLHLAVGLSVS